MLPSSPFEYTHHSSLCVMEALRSANTRTRTVVMTKTLMSGVLLAIASATIGWSVRAFIIPSESGDESSAEEAAVEVAPENMRVLVATAEVTRGDLSLVVVANGVVQAAPGAERSLSSRASGRVIAVSVAKGQFVKQGDLLLRLETAPLETALAQARAALAQSTNQLSEFELGGRDRQTGELRSAFARATSSSALADAQSKRIADLQHEGLASDKALSEAEQAARQAHAELELAERAERTYRENGAQLQHESLVAVRAAAEASVQEAERILAETDVRAPTDGQIVALDARAGANLEVGATFGRMLASSGRVVSFAVAVQRAAELSVGSKATWNDPAGAHHEGHVVSVAGQLDPSSGSIEVLVVADASDWRAPPGLNVRGELETRHLEDVTLVPERAVLRAHDERVVVVAAADDRAKVTKVEVLGRHAGLAAITGEVQAGNRVVVEGGYNLPDGAHIVALPANAAKPLEPGAGASGK